MAARGDVHGAPRIAFGADAPAPTPEQTALATALGDGVSLALANQALRERLRGQALRALLAGLHNRRFLKKVMTQMEAQSARDGRPVAVLVLDHFKSSNDTHGNAVLRAAGTLLTDQLRRSDIACRYGEEELAVLLPGCDIQQAVERAKAIRHAVSLLHEATPAGIGSIALLAVTVPISVAAAPQSAQHLADAPNAADTALYEAKPAGRNRVTAAAPRALSP